MTFIEKIKTPIFWKNTLKITVLIFILLVIISLLLNSFLDIFKFDLAAIEAKNFADGKWKKFIATKGIIAFLYGMFTTARNMR